MLANVRDLGGVRLEGLLRYHATGQDYATRHNPGICNWRTLEPLLLADQLLEVLDDGDGDSMDDRG